MEHDERYIESIRLQNKQRYVNKMFEEEGLTNKVLNEQLEINRKRNELDIHDPTETVYVDDENNEFVQ